MIQHSVIFNLKHAIGSVEETNFFKALRQLALIPGVEEFKCLDQISPSNPFEYGVSMKFKDRQAYDHYNHNEDHKRFVEVFWARDVADFLEIDYTELPE
jgi:hypothetical protein